jgi:tetratricopeptide (TPR) repeat protein
MEKTSEEKLQPLLRLGKYLVLEKENCPKWVTNEIFRKALKMLRCEEFTSINSVIHINFKFLYGKWLSENCGEFDEAFCLLKNALEKFSKNEEDIKEELKNSIIETLCMTLKNQSIKLLAHKLPRKALEVPTKALNYTEIEKLKLRRNTEIEILIYIGRCYLSLENFRKAEKVLNEALKINEIDNFPHLKFNSLKLLSECWESSKDEIGKYEEILNSILQHAIENSMKSAEAEALVLMEKFSSLNNHTMKIYKVFRKR